jgi:probable HAF family extracellular repeat protein
LGTRFNSGPWRLVGGDFTGAFMVNDTGKIVGFAYLSGDAQFHATLWRHVGDMTDLGVLGKDTCSIASSINAKTQVVGASAPGCDFDNARALLWEDDSLSNLNALIPYHPGLLLQKAENINDRGEIAGTGVDPSGNEHAFLLIPCDENHPDVEGCDYSMVDAATAAQTAAPRHVSSGTQRAPLSRRTNRYHMPGLQSPGR